MKKRKNEFYAGSKKKKSPVIPAILVILAAVLVGFGCFYGVKYIRSSLEKKNSDRSVNYSGYEFKTDALNDVKNVMYLGGKALVYEKKDGGMGLIASDGSRKTTADYTQFGAEDTDFHKTVCFALPAGETYPRLVNVQKLTVDKKQYHSNSAANKNAVWNLKAKKADIYSGGQLNTSVELYDPGLTTGLYPICTTDDGSGKWGYVDNALRLTVEPKYDCALDFSQGIAPAKIGEKWGFVDTEGNTVIDFAYDSTTDYTVKKTDFCFGFSGGIAPVKKGSTMGLIDKSGKKIVDFDFTVILPGENGSFIALKDGKWGVLTLKNVPETEKSETTSASAAAINQYRVKTAGSSLSLRAQASKESDRLASVPNGTVVTVTEIVDGWAHTKYQGYDGWLFAEFIEKV